MEQELDQLNERIASVWQAVDTGNADLIEGACRMAYETLVAISMKARMIEAAQNGPARG